MREADVSNSFTFIIDVELSGRRILGPVHFIRKKIWAWELVAKVEPDLLVIGVTGKRWRVRWSPSSQVAGRASGEVKLS